MKKVLTVIFAIFISTGAKATLIASDYTELLTTGQSYSSDFTVSDSFDSVFLDLVIKGDFDNSNSEWFRMYIDGTLIANWSTSTSGLTVVENNPTRDYTLSGLVSISQSLWDSAVADGLLTVTWAIGPYSDPTPSKNGIDFVDFDFNGDLSSATVVSAPSALMIFGLSLILLGYRKL